MLHTNARKARKLRGLKAKIYNKKRYAEKAQLKKTYASKEADQLFSHFLCF